MQIIPSFRDNSHPCILSCTETDLNSIFSLRELRASSTNNAGSRHMTLVFECDFKIKDKKRTIERLMRPLTLCIFHSALFARLNPQAV